MPWARFDDDFWCSPKITAAGNTAAGVFARAITYCAMHLTGGFVSHEIARGFSTKREQNLTTNAALWVPVKGGETFQITGRRDTGKRKLPDVEITIPSRGYFIPDFLHYHPTQAEWDAKREARSLAGAGLNKQANATANAHSHDEANAQAHATANDDSTRARGTRPDPKELPTAAARQPEDPAAANLDEQASALVAIGWTQKQIHQASADLERAVAWAEHASRDASASNPGGLAWSMFQAGGWPARGAPSVAPGAQGTRSSTPAGHVCPHCGVVKAGPVALAEHVADVHYDVPTAGADALLAAAAAPTTTGGDA